MLKNTFTQHIKSPAQTAKVKPLSGFTLAPLTRSIRELMTLAGLAVASSNAWAEVYINPNEIWLHPGKLSGICAQDIDHDGDQDIFKMYEEVVTLLENTGTPEVPEFAQPVAFISNPSNFKLNRLGLTDCRYYNNQSVLVDFDADGDLDLYRGSSKDSDFLYDRNDGSTDYPIYVSQYQQETYGLPTYPKDFMFKDIDHDGDLDFFDSRSAGFYENIGTAENARFIERNESPLTPPCNNHEGFFIDLNNDDQWDTLCRNNENSSFEVIPTSPLGYLPTRQLFNVESNISFKDIQALDIDQDGDMDIIDIGNDGLALYTNTGSRLLPQFGSEPIYAHTPYPYTTGIFSGKDQVFSDLDSDGDFDYLTSTRIPSIASIAYANNTGSILNPDYNISIPSPELHQCTDSFLEIAKSSGASLIAVDEFSLADLDGDNDLDLSAQLRLSNASMIIVHCENQGSPSNPLFTSGIAFKTELRSPLFTHQDIIFHDLDGDHDLDAFVDTIFYDNIGTSTEPKFQQNSHVAIQSETKSETNFSKFLDMNGDGRIDSIIDRLGGGIRLLNKSLEPVTSIASTIVGGRLVLAISRPSQVQILRCGISSACNKTIVLPGTAQELSLSSGNFNSFNKNDASNDIVLAMIDADGHLKTNVYNIALELIATATGGVAHSISVSAGEMGNGSAADEFVVSFVQADGRVAAITYNFDSSQVSKLVANQGSSPSVTVGQFDGTNNGYALAYLTPDGRLESGTYRSDASLIGQGETTLIGTGLAGQIVINAANILPTSPGDEYLTSLIQEDGTAALIGFTADGERLGKIVGNASQQPTIASGHFPKEEDTGLAVSLIQPDGKPAIVFLDNQANYIATGVGSTNASVSTLAMTDIDNDGIDEGMLIYIDQAGIPRWEIFGFDGVKK